MLSDKNRIAESRHPSLDKKTLEELKRAGPPGIAAPPAQSAQMSPPVQQGAPSQQPNQSQNQQMAQLAAECPIPSCRASAGQPSRPVNFADMMKSPGDLTAQAARAVAARRGGGTYGGGGDYGVGPGGSARALGNLEVLSDTQGVDFGPYLVARARCRAR